MAKAKTKDERLFSAAVLRRSFQLRGEEHKAAFRFVYEGVLRDLDVEEAEVERFLEEHREQVEAAIGRNKP
jgi:Xaa-Pro aminopeptidase